MYVTEFFTQLWSIYQLRIPFLDNISIGDFCIGFFVVLVSIKIYRNHIDGDS